MYKMNGAAGKLDAVGSYYYNYFGPEDDREEIYLSMEAYDKMLANYIADSIESSFGWTKLAK